MKNNCCRTLLLALLAMFSISSASAQRCVDAMEKKIQKRHAGVEDVRNTFGIDLSPVWHSHGYIGFIGPDYQRLKVSINDVERKEQQTYELRGRMESPRYSCDVKGELLVLHIYTKAPTKTGHLKGEQLYDIFGVYRLTETGTKSGRFEGFVISEVFTQDGRAYPCGMDEAGADFRNNQFEGVWISEDNGLQKEANWGIGRIPDSGDLDIGKEMFKPAEKYWKSGWETYEQDARDEATDYMNSLYASEGVIDDHLTWKSWADIEGFAKTTLFCDGEPIRVFRSFHGEDTPPFMMGAGVLTYVDANFDNYPDVLISLGSRGSRHFSVYECYLYDPATETFLLTEGFDLVINPTFDAQRKVVYGCGHSSYATIEHRRFEWQGNRISEKSIVEVTINEEGNPISYSESQVIDRGDSFDFIPLHENVQMDQLSPEWQEHLAKGEEF